MEAAKTAKVEVVDVDGRATIVLEGAVDIFFAADLRQAAVELLQKGEDVAICCDKLERLDTATLQVLLALKKELAQNGRTLHWGALAPGAGAVIGLAGLSGHLS
jgi:anti-anti-sigma regulatory factor